MRPATIATLALIFIAAVFATHYRLLSMPYFWDEVGQFIPASQDLYRDGSLVPVSATPNVHPPGVMAWIALWWKVLGPSIAVTRCAMLLLGALALLVAFLLAVELSGSTPGMPALFAVLLLACAPIFYTQSLLAQLDMPAMLFTGLAFLLFLREKHPWAVAACCALVLVKETGAIVPALFLAWLAAEKRFRRAAFYAIPLALLAGWLGLLYWKTGHVLGNAEFARYNAGSAMRLSHVGFSFARRLYFLFVDHFHWIGTLALIPAWRAGLFERRRWRVAAVFVAAHVVLVSLFGGAVLERYLLPVLPFFYTAAVIGLFELRPALRWSGYAAMAVALVAGLFINPLLWPFPYENNLAVKDFTTLHKQAAEWLEERAPGRVIATAWPMSAELSKPEMGYVSRKMMVVEMPDFAAARADSLPKDGIDVFVLYSRDWDPDKNVLRTRAFRWAARMFLDYNTPITGDDLQARMGMVPVWSRSQHGQWVEIYAKPSAGLAQTATAR